MWSERLKDAAILLIIMLVLMVAGSQDYHDAKQAEPAAQSAGKVVK